ncbi:MAG: hypothetical protein ACK6D1_06795 [Planctomycetota bacterium]
MRPRRHTLLLLGLAACAAPADFAYSETDALPGADLPTRLAHVSQLDLLPDTTGDHERCSCAAALTGYLLLGGSFGAAAGSFGIGPELTFANVHRLQEALLRAANVDGEDNGVLGSTVPEYDGDGRLPGWHLHPKDEFHHVLAALGLAAEPLLGPTRAAGNDRSAPVAAALAAGEPTVFVFGCHGGLADGAIAPPDATHDANHYALAYVADGRAWLFDSFRRPGHLARRELSADELRAYLDHNPITPYWLRLANPTRRP